MIIKKYKEWLFSNECRSSIFLSPQFRYFVEEGKQSCIFTIDESKVPYNTDIFDVVIDFINSPNSKYQTVTRLLGKSTKKVTYTRDEFFKKVSVGNDNFFPQFKINDEVLLFSIDHHKKFNSFAMFLRKDLMVSYEEEL